MSLLERIETMIAQHKQGARIISGSYDLRAFGLDIDAFVVNGTARYEHETDDLSKEGTFRAWIWSSEHKEFLRLDDTYYPDKVSCIEGVIHKYGGS